MQKKIRETGPFNGRMTAALIEFMTGDERRETGARLGLRAKRRSAFAALGNGQAIKKIAAENGGKENRWRGKRGAD